MLPKRPQANTQLLRKRRRDSAETPVELKGLHFEIADDCAAHVELTSLAKQVQRKRDGVPALKAMWRRAGFDDTLIPNIDGIRVWAFPMQRGKPRGKLMPAADSKGLQAYVRELGQKNIDDRERLLTAVAAKLGDAPLQLESKHKLMQLERGTHIHVPIVDACPRMVLAQLLQALGVADPHQNIRKKRDTVHGEV